MAHVQQREAASQQCKAYTDLLRDEQYIRALLAPCLHPFATVSPLANAHSRDTVTPECFVVGVMDLMWRCLCSRGK
jgi:hypothetical protein